MGLMRTRGLGWAAILMVAAALAPTAARGQGGLDTAPGYALPDINAPSPLYSTRPEEGWFVHGGFAVYRTRNTLDDETVVMPGHGPNTTIGEAKREYAEYLQHPWPSDFFGDVEWLKPPPPEAG